MIPDHASLPVEEIRRRLDVSAFDRPRERCTRVNGPSALRHLFDGQVGCLGCDLKFLNMREAAAHLEP